MAEQLQCGRIKEALGIREIDFCFYSPTKDRSHWKVELKDGGSFRISAPHLASESTLLKVAADRLAKMGRAVRWP